MEVFSLTLNISTNSLSNLTTNYSFKKSASPWGFQNCYLLLDLRKIWQRFWGLKKILLFLFGQGCTDISLKMKNITKHRYPQFSLSHFPWSIYHVKCDNENCRFTDCLGALSCKSCSTITNVLPSVKSIRSLVIKTPQQLEIITLHHSSLIIHPSSFFMHPSFILRLLSFSACWFSL